MNGNRFYTLKELYGDKFYRLPKVFFTHPKYKDMSNDAKISWSILRDRHELSKSNGWIDEDGRIYFLYSNEKLGEILGLSKNTITKVKKELKKAELIVTKKLGQGKPDILYLLRPELREEDIYLIDKSEKIDEEESAVKESEEERKSKKEQHLEPEKQSPKIWDSSKPLGGVETPKKWDSKIPKNGTLDSQNLTPNDTDPSDIDSSDTENLKLNLINELWNLDIPIELKRKIKVKINAQQLFITSNQLCDLEHAYRYQIEKGLIVPNARYDEDGLNNIEFTDTIIEMLNQVKEIGSMRAIVDSWVKQAFNYKYDKVRNLIG